MSDSVTTVVPPATKVSGGGQVISQGNPAGMYFGDGPTPTNFEQAKTTNESMFAAFFHAMLDRGVYLAPALYEAGFVSAAHTADDVAATLDAASAAYRALD